MIESNPTARRLELELANLDCEQDAARIQQRLSDLAGLTAVAVHPKAARVALAYYPETISPDQITDTLAELGFPHKAEGDSCGCGDSSTTSTRLQLLPGQEQQLRRRAWWLTAATIAWNLIEAVVAIGSGLVAGSIALVGFGLDSLVEVSSALVTAWRLSSHSTDREANERNERLAVRLIAGTFFLIAAYVAYDSISKLLGIGDEPEHSTIGLALTALSVVVMPTLAWAKRKVATALGSVALKADAAETQLCVYLSIVVFLGLGANSLFGWWWMDPVAGLFVAGLAVKEGWEAWRGGELCEC
jgi:cation transport ATPase